MKTKIVIMAGGKGTRISELFPDIPKPLIPIDGVPVLEREIRSLKEQGYNDFIFTLSYMAEKIADYFGDGSNIGVNIDYYIEETPLGNAGALFKMRDKLPESDPFFLLNADSVFDIDFNRMLSFHKEHNALVTLFSHPNSHPYDSGLLIADETDKSVTKWLTKEDKRPEFYKNKVNAGIHIIDPKVLDMSKIAGNEVGKRDPVTGKIKKVDLDRDILKPLCSTHKMYCYDSPEYCKDMGTPERYEAVKKDFSLGIVRRKNLRNRQRAIFLDRDGTLNKYIGFLRKPEELELLPGVAEAVKMINESAYLAIICTNQPVIARGEVSFEGLNEIHNKLETLLGYEGTYTDGIYYCPHHPHKGYEGELPELKIECECRKPKPGLLLKAAEDLNIDLENSWMVGDSENDVLAGKNAGCHTALIVPLAEKLESQQSDSQMNVNQENNQENNQEKSQENKERSDADITVHSLLEAVVKILQQAT